MTQSFGVIETIGLTAATHAADAACKAADVRLTGYRKVGAGLVSVYFEGEVSAVKVAVESGVHAIRSDSEQYMSLVIARPDSSVLEMLRQGGVSSAIQTSDRGVLMDSRTINDTPTAVIEPKNEKDENKTTAVNLDKENKIKESVLAKTPQAVGKAEAKKNSTEVIKAKPAAPRTKGASNSKLKELRND